MPPFCGAGQQFTTKQIALTQRSRVCAFLLNGQQASKGESYFGFWFSNVNDRIHQPALGSRLRTCQFPESPDCPETTAIIDIRKLCQTVTNSWWPSHIVVKVKLVCFVLDVLPGQWVKVNCLHMVVIQTPHKEITPVQSSDCQLSYEDLCVVSVTPQNQLVVHSL